MLLAALLLVLQGTPARAAAAPHAERAVPYRTIDGDELALDVLLPAGDGPHPALLLVHGGAWMHGDRRDMAPFAERLVRRGFACFAPSYRLAPAHRYPAQIEDCLAAVQFVRAEAQRFGVDPERVGALGLSAGGHLVALLGVLDDRADPKSTDARLRQSTRVQCVVDYFGPALLSRTQELDFDTRPPPELFGDAPDSAYVEASPLTHVSAGDAPFLLVHGDADTVVPIGHALLLDEKLRAAGVASELVVVPGGGHGDFFAKDPNGEHWQRVEAFLDAQLKPKR